MCCIDGKEYFDEPRDTGVIKCVLYGRTLGNRTWGNSIPVHAWIEYPGGSTGFWPAPTANEFLPTIGWVAYPKDPYEGSIKDTVATPIMLSPCKYNIQVFVSCISRHPGGNQHDNIFWGTSLNLVYQVPSSMCIGYANKLIYTCMKEAAR